MHGTLCMVALLSGITENDLEDKFQKAIIESSNTMEKAPVYGREQEWISNFPEDLSEKGWQQ